MDSEVREEPSVKPVVTSELRMERTAQEAAAFDEDRLSFERPEHLGVVIDAHDPRRSDEDAVERTTQSG